MQRVDNVRYQLVRRLYATVNGSYHLQLKAGTIFV